jgi:hypothetical protein
MKILFDALQDDQLLENLKGELTLQGKSIVWSYDIIKNSEQHGDDNEEGIELMIDDGEFRYKDYISTEEMLQEAYDDDIELLQNYIYELGDCIDRNYSDPKLTSTVISFKIS